MSECKKVVLEQLVVDGVTYVPKGQEAPAKPGKRCILVADRGWVFAGDAETVNGRILLTRACIVQRWDSIGFDGLCNYPVNSKVTVKPCSDIDLPSDTELFRVPCHDNWGIK